MDAIVHVVRAFDDENVMREQGREDAFVDPLADIDTINLELILADLESVNKRYARVEKMARTQKIRIPLQNLTFSKRLNQFLKTVSRLVPLNSQTKNKKWSKGLFLLTTKPVLYVANVDEDVVGDQIRSIM